MKILIYSAEFGDYETELRQPVLPPLCQDVMYNYKRFSENEERRRGIWHHREPLQQSDKYVDVPQLRARFHKIDPFAVLHDEQRYDFTIWVDASMTLLADPFDLVKLLGDNDVMTFRHRHRDDIVQEGNTVIKIKNQDPRVIQAQINFQRQAGYRDFVPLPETGLLVRRVSSRTRRFSEEWWNQVKTFSVRDQMSFGFAAWKAGIKVGFFPGHVRSGRYNTLHNHRRQKCRTRPL